MSNKWGFLSLPFTHSLASSRVSKDSLRSLRVPAEGRLVALAAAPRPALHAPSSQAAGGVSLAFLAYPRSSGSRGTQTVRGGWPLCPTRSRGVSVALEMLSSAAVAQEAKTPPRADMAAPV